ncbi:hypothetical protein [Aeromonas caviae]|uniref:hypothetical protein n=1 Tax=Aeromonas caviae TaxID=648 RepID=UPI0038D00C2C
MVVKKLITAAFIFLAFFTSSLTPFASESADKFWSNLDSKITQESLNQDKSVKIEVDTKLSNPTKILISLLSISAVVLVFYFSTKKIKSNSKARAVILSSAMIIFVMMCVVPPWKYVVNTSMTRKEAPAGYSLIYISPSTEGLTINTGVTIDVERLFIQLVALAGLTSIFLINTKK